MIKRISYRNMYVNDALKKIIQKKMNGVSKYNLGLIRIDTVVQKNKYFLKPEDKFNCYLSVADNSGFTANINNKGDSPGKAVENAFNRLRKAIRRHHRKLYDSRRRMIKRSINKSIPDSLVSYKEDSLSFN
jgi:ribosome-associated translation inhibitor RaiA